MTGQSLDFLALIQNQSVPLCVKKLIQDWDWCVVSAEAAQFGPFSYFFL